MARATPENELWPPTNERCARAVRCSECESSVEAPRSLRRGDGHALAPPSLGRAHRDVQPRSGSMGR
eukprot:403631-Prymnesium_polylepis.1